MVMHNKTKTAAISLASILFLAVLVVPSVYADESIVDVITINVPVSCSMSATGTDSHTATVNNGQTTENIGTTNLKVICNDNSGYAIYAIGYTDDTYGKTVLTSSTLGSTHDIATATTVTTGTSSWAMKLASVSGTYAPIVAGSTGDSLKVTGDPDFSDYTAVPEEYTKVAYYTSSTDTGNNATGSNLTTTYRAYISPSQPAGTYIGQVKYTLVHPSSAPAPVTFEIAYANANKQKYKGYYKMQDMTESICNSINVYDEASEAFLIDERDDNVYSVRKMDQWGCIMTSNLRFTGTSLSSDTSNVTEDTTIVWYDLETNGAGYCSDNSADYACKHEGVDGNGDDTVWYNYAAASAMTITGNRSGSAVYNICPQGWTLPSGSNLYNGSPTFDAVYGGYYRNGSLKNANQLNIWWTAKSFTSSADGFDGSGSSPNNFPRGRGFYIRCSNYIQVSA